MKMGKMWQLLLILSQLLLMLLLSSELYAAEPELEHRQSLANRLSLGMAKQLYADRDNRNVNRNDNRNVNRNDNDNENDDDYYTDNDNDSAHNRDSLRSDINLIDYATPRPSNWPRFPSSRSASTAATPTYRVRVPRHPHAHAPRLDNDNHLDASAASDEAGYQSDQVPGVLTAQKQKEVGSPESVQSSHSQYMMQKDESQFLRHLANKNLESIANEPLCKLPQPRVIRMDFETSKTYRPHVAVLHRCDENSSCCPTKTVWTAKNTTIVEKVFWVRSVGIPNSHPRIISLTNHTECHCISRAAQRRKRSSQCQCPKHFINFGVQQGGAPSSCRCDCHLSHTTCQRMKNGDEGFAVSELRCIRSNACSPPVCNYGLFNTTIGRCPRQLGFG